MDDAWIPLGLLIFIALFAYALVRGARRQRRAKATIFSDFAHRHGLSYLPGDDGTAQAFARDFHGIARFDSPSLGRVEPEDVVTGSMDGRQVVLFRHRIRYGEGWAREWYVAGLVLAEPMARGCAVQFCKRRSHRSTLYLEDGIVKERQLRFFTLVVRAAAPAAAGCLMEDRVLAQLDRLAGGLPFRPEIQVRGARLIAYPADRNAVLDDGDALAVLVRFAGHAADIRDAGSG